MIPSSLMPTYARADVAFERGEGAYLYDAAGRRFLDFAGGVAVTSLGHCHPHLVEALTRQANTLWHTSNLYQIPLQEKLAQRLVENSFADLAFFGNSGAEAGELAIKVTRKYHAERGHPERFRIITCAGAFHGRTLATLAATGNEKYLAGFGPKVEGFDQVPYNNLNALRDAITPATAGILVEPVQGEGGVKPADPEFLKGLRRAADEFGLLLIFDEVQSGMGRTGKLWAHEWSGVTPDVMMVAKGLGGGFPIGGVLATRAAASCMTAGTHGSTFGGNPLAAATANAVLDVMLAPGFFDGVQRHAKLFGEMLDGQVKAHPTVLKEARGMGMIRGLVPSVPAGDFAARLRNENFLAVTAGENVVRMVPPLIIGETEIAEAKRAIDAVARSFES
ncbi:MAG TPA: aspartate aminotransferase family protein [Stellaceae bacterium]|jgi:acetylornithine/N-succinyldiaminopimelate aminotransferase|nr:aspartate aminotransferase family protein [Stellaceae bacterium]